MGFKWAVISLIIHLNIPGSLAGSMGVTCYPQTICALRESAVELKCSYSDTNIKIHQSFWFSKKQKAKWRNKEDPEDLALDSDFAGRVTYTQTTDFSTLTITDLRERDSGEYQLMIITETGEKHPGSTAVTLTVSDLQLIMTSSTGTERKQTLTCNSSCKLTSNPLFYYWFNNGVNADWSYENQKVLSIDHSDDSGSYTCSVSPHYQIRSNTVCVFKNCWSVNYPVRRVCVLEGSSVDFPCSYSYPSDATVNEVFWFYNQPGVEPTDVSVEDRFAGRVEFLGNKQGNCTLRMRNLTKSDSGEYRFRFITDIIGGSFSGKPGVILDVSDLQVKVSPTTPSEGQSVTLTCISTCTLSNNLIYIWYKNRQPVTNKPTRYNQLYLESESSEDVLHYSCALGEGPVHVAVFVIVGVAVFLALILIAGWMLKRRRRSSPGKDHTSTEQSGQCDSAPVYDNVSALVLSSDPTQTGESDNQDGLHYSSVCFRPSQTFEELPPPSSTLDLHVTEDFEIQYAAVNFSRDSAATQ